MVWGSSKNLKSIELANFLWSFLQNRLKSCNTHLLSFSQNIDSKWIYINPLTRSTLLKFSGGDLNCESFLHLYSTTAKTKSPTDVDYEPKMWKQCLFLANFDDLQPVWSTIIYPVDVSHFSFIIIVTSGITLCHILMDYTSNSCWITFPIDF